ncbi:FHA domain-containing protein [Arthrobacter crusticola]|uniref:FHA domain-containing protein n=1 Tax=Arthrobacter crusticola TaxID=2547960 RepID=A0A4R5TPT7_9MICC|nr:FHA domain-containing protein [Arthrobacter crusticola]TDK24208.1 FHA domain-containing protein [Arthrobacter crusticola]
MVGDESAAVNEGGHHVESPETTTIGLPPQAAFAEVERHLTKEEQASVAALPAGSALLVAHSGPNAGARFLLDEDVTKAGRHPNADIFLDDVTVSRQHAEFRRTPNGFMIVDTRSLNGTYVNNDRVDSVVLRSGNEVQIGKFRLTFYAARATTAGQTPSQPAAQA